MTLRIGLCLLLVSTLVSAARGADGRPGEQLPQSFQGEKELRLEYLLYLPKDYESRESWPLILFLHGAGERGDDLEQVKKHGPPKLIAGGKELPFIVVSPQCRSKSSWTSELDALLGLLDDVQEHYKVDKSRIYLTGLSMGGFGTWALAAKEPERFAAIAPICGGGDVNYARSYGKLPIWVFHGGKDTAVPLARSEAMVEAVKEQDGNVKLTVYPDAGHDSWTETYNNPEFFSWLLEQQREEP